MSERTKRERTGGASKEPLRAAWIRERNEKLVLEELYREGPASQSDVVVRTGLKAPTVFRIFERLAAEGLIGVVEGRTEAREGRPGDRKGRKPVFYAPQRDALFAAGADFRAGEAAVSVMDFSGAEVARVSVPLDPGTDADGTCRALSRAVSDAIERAAVPRDRLLGLGVGAPGRVDPARGTVDGYPRIAGLNGYPLVERLEAEIGLPVRLHNNATVIALSEFRRGRRAGTRSLFALLLRSGVGAGFVVDGMPWSSGGRSAFEVAHAPTRSGTTECRCGRRGCLETLLSEEALLRAASKPSLPELSLSVEVADPGTLSALQPAFSAARDLVATVWQLLFPESFAIVTRSAALSAKFASECRAELESRGSDAFVYGNEWNPSDSCRSACESVFDLYFA